tara:strand:+ start:1687 stop:2187 length:501 start_codon:yes stop_codon:yes gene_type:complete
MGCGCNSNFSNFSKEIKEKINVDEYEALLKSRNPRDIGQLQNRLSIWGNRSNPQGEELQMLNSFKERATARMKVIGLLRNADMIANAIKTNEGNPNFDALEYKEKERLAREQVKDAEKVYNQLSGIEEEGGSETKSFLKTNKNIIIIGFGIGVAILVGFKLYKKYN